MRAGSLDKAAVDNRLVSIAFDERCARFVLRTTTVERLPVQLPMILQGLQHIVEYLNNSAAASRSTRNGEEATSILRPSTGDR